MTDEEFNFLAKKLSGIVWHCSCCQAGTARLEDSIRQLEKRVKENEDKIEKIEGREKLVENRLEKVERAAGDASKAAEATKQDTLQVVFEELRERDEKKYNVILHNVGESEEGGLETEKSWDADSFDNVMREIHVNLNFGSCATSAEDLEPDGPAALSP